MKIVDSIVKDSRYPNRKFWTFKHKPGTGGAAHFRQFLDQAYDRNVCMMQYEYKHQGSAEVTRNWNAVSAIKEGDVVFLRGDDCLYAYGIVKAHGLRPGKNVIVSNIKKTVGNNSHGDGNNLQSKDYHGFVVFEDSNVFYEDLRDGPDAWGQRIMVEQWVCYCKEGIGCKSLENYINPDRYAAVMEMTGKAARRYLGELTKKFYEEKGIDSMIIELLEENKNLILTGAPGTGKTYLAREMAMVLAKSKERIVNVQFHPSYSYSDFVEGLRPVKKGDTLGFERRDGAFMELCRMAITHPDENFVIIIDEINRGDISKIFGELFSLIEADYRTFTGSIEDKVCAVKTQYNNLWSDGAPDVGGSPDATFKDGFFVPPNIFIIGTMNDVDRSVESMDFAIRRRFSWHEVDPKDRFDVMCAAKGFDDVQKKDVLLRMNALNEKVRSDSALGAAYQVGPAYFMKLVDGDYEGLWIRHLSLLFREYLRGTPDIENRVEAYHQILINVKPE